MDRVCEVCAGPLRKDNIYGVCWKTRTCVLENKRREAKRMSEDRRERQNEYARTNPKQIANRESYRQRLRREHPLYSVWVSMKGRCLTPSNASYADYGGRGITVCERWRKFANFEADVLAEIGPRPEGRYPNGNSKFQFGRINNDGNYELGNIQWETVRQNANNRRSSLPMVTALRKEVERLRRENAELRAKLAVSSVPAMSAQ